MYNKIFTKILDSSIWLEDSTTRIVWITLIAAMDEDGYAHFSSIKNLSIRAQVSIEDTEKSVEILSSPDPDSADPEFEGRRVERVPGGFVILNACKYKDIVTRTVARERTRRRVQKFREKKNVTQCNVVKQNVTPSVSYTESVSETNNTIGQNKFDLFWSVYPKRVKKKESMKLWKSKQLDDKSDVLVNDVKNRIENDKQWSDGFIPDPPTYLRGERWEDEIQTNGANHEQDNKSKPGKIQRTIEAFKRHEENGTFLCDPAGNDRDAISKS